LGIGILLCQGGIGSISSLLHTLGPAIAHHIPHIPQDYYTDDYPSAVAQG